MTTDTTSSSDGDEPPSSPPVPRLRVRAALGRAGRAFEDGIERLGATVPWLVWPAVYAVCLGGGAWGGRHPEAIDALANHKITFEQRVDIAWHIAGSAAALAVVYLLVVVVDRIVVRRWRGITRVNDLNRVFRWLLGVPIFVFLQKKGIEQEANWVLLLCAAAGLAVGYAVVHLPHDVRPPSDAHLHGGSRWPVRWRRLAPWVAGFAVLGLWAFYGYRLSEFAITNHHALNTRTTDLGYYDNIFYQSLHGRPLGCSFVKGGNHISAHFDPILVLLSPLYLLYPRAELLLGLQSVWLGAGVVPVYLMGASVLGARRYGLGLALIYVLYPALHGANMYEFHSLTLITPLVLWLLYFLEHRHFKSYAVTLLLLWLCREDVPLITTFIGFYAVISGRPTFVRVGYLTILFSFVYFVVVKTHVMPAPGLFNDGSKEGYSYEYYFRELIPHKNGARGLALTLISNPMKVLDFTFGDKQKIQYLLTLFLPLGFAPLFAKRARIMLLYGVAVALLASRKPVYKPHFQYACMIFPIAFAIAPMGLRRLLDDPRTEQLGFKPPRLLAGVIAGMLVAASLVSWKYGVFWKNTAFRGGFSKIARPPLDEKTRTRYLELRKMVDMIPPGASVTTTNRLGPHVSNRKEVYFYRQKKRTHFVLIDLSELKKRRGWHDDRVRAGELVELRRYRKFVLYRVISDKAAEAKRLYDARRKKDRAATKPKPKPTPKPAPSATAAPHGDGTPATTATGGGPPARRGGGPPPRPAPVPSPNAPSRSAFPAPTP
ncbi:MAG: DUF2079 domain-containing protein [Myxococcota bacterium]